ncbi:SMP-30/gluconolactonase/LRE family protein [Hymenobacter cavernae]|uniref:Phage head-tail adapter protein n=1 Tax=Hymenobacter cavernae TaxID=2044852 RepID=A0ABQ1U0C6_9BACT|nr:SMP-30/gluconolactonase/LRE family protein [Hymenobacter cavernae]GGF07432.1 phage head-tail adapter protein [Hymenobacter cavernae]
MNHKLMMVLLSGALLAGCQQKKNTPQEEQKAAATDSAAAAVDTSARVGATPKLLFKLPDKYNTPDGLALAPNGNLILSVPNLADNKYPAALLEIVGDSARLFLTNLPVQPDTKKAAPMDLAFGPDGNLYYAENQYENDKDFKSRLMRVRIRGGKPSGVETVVENFALANGVVWKGNDLYVTDSQWDLPDDPKGSAIMHFTLSELTKGGIKLKPKTMDPHVLTTFTTAVNETGVDNGADGIDYDSKGRLYTGSFGDGTLYRITLKPDGSFASKEIVAVKGEKIPCIDGLIVDRKTDKVYVCNSRENAIQVVAPDGTVTTLARNGDTDGAGGKLDQPAEVLLKGNRLYISDFDKPEKNFVNQKSDAPHTESYIDLQ